MSGYFIGHNVVGKQVKNIPVSIKQILILKDNRTMHKTRWPVENPSPYRLLFRFDVTQELIRHTSVLLVREREVFPTFTASETEHLRNVGP